MARFPQLDWVAINGRDTPFTKPQHYKKGSTSETDLTGHDNPLPTTDERVRTELELIKQENMEIKQSQTDIISALQTSNENLQATNESLMSVIKDNRLQSDTQLIGSIVEDDNALPTKILASNHSEVYLENKTVVAGGAAVQNIPLLKGTRIGVGIRLSRNAKFEVRFQHNKPGSSAAISPQFTLIKATDTPNDRGMEDFKLLGSSGSIVVLNRDESDFDVDFVAVTEFMASGGSE